MGLFFNRQEFTLGLDAKIQELESQIYDLNQRLHDVLNYQNRMESALYNAMKKIQVELSQKISNEVAKQIQSAKAVEKAHEKHPSLEKRMKTKRTRRVGTYAEKQYTEPYRLAWALKTSGCTYNQIIDALNAKGFTPPHSKKFNADSLYNLMNNHHQKEQMKYDQAKQAKQIAIQTDSQRNFLNGIM
jgi:hypothetical protein